MLHSLPELTAAAVGGVGGVGEGLFQEVEYNSSLLKFLY